MFDCLRRIKSEGIEIEGGQMIASFYFLVSFF